MTLPPRAACIPADEAQRLETLRKLGLLDSAPSASFDRATRLAAALLRVPIALISLVDENRQWFKSKVGLSAAETSREVSFCAHAVFNREPLVIGDATQDARFAGNPLVTGAPHIRAYLGIPLFSREGHAIGTLCAIDTEVRAFTDEDIRYLVDCTEVIEELVHSEQVTQSNNAILRLATEREQRFQCLVRLTSQVIWTNSATGRMEGEQPAWGAFTGQTFEEYQGFGWSCAVHPEDSQPTIDAWNQAVAERRPFLFEHRVRRHDGEYRLCRIDAAPVLNDDGSIREWVGVHNDITERRQQVEKIRAQEADFRFLADSVPQMVWTARADGTADYYNKKWFNFTGMSALQAASGEWAAIHPDDIDNSVRVWNQSVETGDPYQVEHRFRRVSDGAYRWHLCRALRLSDEHGETIKWFGTCTDIHDYKEAEAKNLALRAELEERVRQRTAALESANSALRASEEFLDRAGRVAGVGGWSVDLESLLIQWSDQTCVIHEVAVGHHPSMQEAVSYYTPEAQAILNQAIGECVSSAKAFDLELPLKTAKGRHIWVRAAGEAEFHEGKAVRMFGAFQDVTARKLAQADLAQQHELMRVTLQSIADAVITTDDRGAVQWLNPVAAAMTGWSVEEAQGRPIDDVFHVLDENTRERAASPVVHALLEAATPGLPGHTILVSRDGTEYGIQESAAPIRDQQGNSLGVVLVFRDVSEQRRLAHEVNYRASHDALTGLVNRAEFDFLLKHALSSARGDERGHALLFIDLDQFKVVNDACGHSAGDLLLRQVSEIFQKLIRSHDTLARLGGDEFGVILQHCSVDQAQRVAAKFCESLESYRFVHDEKRFRVGASIGLVPIDHRWLDTSSLMQAADASCYAAKEAGRNRVHEWVEADERMKERQWDTQWVNRLEQALDENWFRLYAQRIAPCSAKTSGLSMEVLLRLVRPDGGIIAPSAFLPAAERFHMASRIDRWVVREVLQWMRNHPIEGVDSISVNLSGQSIGDRSFHRYVSELVSSVSFDLRKLCFEITETAAITNMGEAVEFINAMRSFGIRIALDDFGAGASSFGYLKHMHVDILKIDGQFVRDLLHDRLDHTAVCCFRDVAAVKGLKTVAEFVESDEVFNELHRIGIDFAQGFLIHRPEPIENLLAIRTVVELKSNSKMPRLAAG